MQVHLPSNVPVLPEPRRAATLLVGLILVTTTVAAADHTLKAPLSTANRASYLAIASETLVQELGPLLDYRRSQGHETGLVSVESLETALGISDRRILITRYLARAAETFALAPQLVLLAGDTDTIPTYKVGGIPTDHPYSCPRDPRLAEIAIGRLPARSRQELACMVGKTLALERRAPGLWQRQLAFFAGVGGFSFDSVLESVATRILSRTIPFDYDVEMTYGSPTSPYFYPPHRFASLMRSRIEEGPL
ncbi:C25 family cysteine peptidase, partial [Planctomycetota bacterium]